MTSASPATRVLGSLRSSDGKGIVCMEDRYDTDIDDLWSALTDPDRLVRWYGRVEGDLRPGGQFRLYVEDADADATGRVEACEPPRRLRVTSRETDDSYQRGNGVPPYDGVIEATLTADGDQTILVIEVQGMPVDVVAFYGAGWQIHVENLAVYVAGRERGDTEARWAELVPPYQDLAANIDGWPVPSAAPGRPDRAESDWGLTVTTRQHSLVVEGSISVRTPDDDGSELFSTSGETADPQQAAHLIHTIAAEVCGHRE